MKTNNVKITALAYDRLKVDNGVSKYIKVDKGGRVPLAAALLRALPQPCLNLTEMCRHAKPNRATLPRSVAERETESRAFESNVRHRQVCLVRIAPCYFVANFSLSQAINFFCHSGSNFVQSAMRCCPSGIMIKSQSTPAALSAF